MSTNKGENDLNRKRSTVSLLTSQSTGGDIAESGFQYQANWTIAQIPIWLAQDGFTEMIRESLGDVEAKFFVPSVGLRREFVQCKNYSLTPNKFWEEIEDFQKKDQQTPDSYHRFVLACKSVSIKLHPIINALRRVRDAYSFYDTAQKIQTTSYNDFIKVVKNQGQSKAIAHFLFSKVWFDMDDGNHHQALFRENLLKHFPFFTNYLIEVSNVAHLHLVELVRSRKNQPIYRQELEDIIWKEVEEKDKSKPVRIHTLHDKTANKGPDGCLQFDWTSFFGGSERHFPPPQEWNQKVIGELRATKDWLVATNRERHIHLSGHRRLSASIVIGSIFSAVSGFTIGMEVRDEVWWTNSHANEDTPDYQWQQSTDGELTDEIAVGISILKDAANEEVKQYLQMEHFHGRQLYLYSDMVLESDAQTNRAVQKAKSMIQEFVSKSQAKKIYLFFAGPAQFALFLGHRLNTIGKIQCYEWTSPNAYVPTVLIKT